jgi:molybdenum cofactor biosynthesis enzyme MoaA
MKVSEKVDNRTHVPKERLIESPSFPTDMKIEVTSRCNYNCVNCATGQNLRPVGDMDFTLFCNISLQAHNVGVKEMGLFLLGESFLLDNIQSYVATAKGTGIEYVYITTNGSLCTPQNMQAVMNAGLDSLKFSLNAGTWQEYDRITGKDRFNTVMKNIKWISEYRNDKINLSVSCIYDDEHPNEMEDLKNDVSKYVEDFYFLPNMCHGGYVNGSSGNIGRLENPVDPVPCWELFNTSRVTWDGYLTMCSFDHEGVFKIADLKKVKLIDAWNDSKFIELRKAHLLNNINDTICNRCINGN